ncbi:hypothetical protein, partial [Limosilactobacillus fermentum]|uniref:hypothetical protein n=1 Tax=Limosilactobacillus fermentum TaxID=1613 RepID=UPI002182368C
NARFYRELYHLPNDQTGFDSHMKPGVHERKLKKGGARCKHRPPPKMTHQQDLTKSPKSLFACLQCKH